MRTLTLLAALFLLALQARADAVPEKAEDVLAEQQPEKDDEDVAAPFEDTEDSGPQDADEILDAERLNPVTAEPGVTNPLSPGLRPGLRPHRHGWRPRPHLLRPGFRPRPHSPPPGVSPPPLPLSLPPLRQTWLRPRRHHDSDSEDEAQQEI